MLVVMSTTHWLDLQNKEWDFIWQAENITVNKTDTMKPVLWETPPPPPPHSIPSFVRQNYVSSPCYERINYHLKIQVSLYLKSISYSHWVGCYFSMCPKHSPDWTQCTVLSAERSHIFWAVSKQQHLKFSKKTPNKLVSCSQCHV